MGSLFLPRLSSMSGVVGETKACQIVSRTSIPPDKGMDFLLCSYDTQLDSDLQPGLRTGFQRIAIDQKTNSHQL